MTTAVGTAVPRSERPPGKRVRGSLYVHVSATRGLGERHCAAIATALRHAPDARWNVARVGPRSVGLMLYEDFDDAAFPALLHATKVDLASGAVRRTDYARTRNRLILHRKEQTVAADDPRVAAWCALTDELAGSGLFEEPTRIGRQQAWTAMLRGKGFEISGSTVCRTP